MSKILFVRPKNYSRFSNSQPPLELLSLAGYARKMMHQVDFIDLEVENDFLLDDKLKKNFDYVCVAYYTLNRKTARMVVEKVKRISPASKVIVGTIFCEDSMATTLWEFLLQNFPDIDICILGEAENTLIEILDGKELKEIDGIACRDHGKAIKNKDREVESDLDKFGNAAWDLLDLKKYKSTSTGIFNGIDLGKEITIPLRFSRGCIGFCRYCALWWMWKKWRTRSGQSMAGEIIELSEKYGLKSFEFRDDCFGVNKNEVIEFCNEII